MFSAVLRVPKHMPCRSQQIILVFYVLCTYRDRVARRQVGAVLLTAHHASTERNQTIFFIVAQFIFGCAQSAFVLCRAFDAAACNLVLLGFGQLSAGTLALPCHIQPLTQHLCCFRSYGVGGEYPMAAGSAAERAETGGIQKARFRGREVVLTFSMQVALTALRRKLFALPRQCYGCHYAPSRQLRVLQPGSVDICLE